MTLKDETAIAIVAKLAMKPMQGRPTIIRDDKKTLQWSNDLWNSDVLGKYNPATVEITLFTKAIHQASECLKLPEDDLCLVVLLHELGHWLWHMALDDHGNNWQDYGQVAPNLCEPLAQMCVCWASYAEELDEKRELFNHVLFKLMKKQSSVYQLPEGDPCLRFRRIKISTEYLSKTRCLQNPSVEEVCDKIFEARLLEL